MQILITPVRSASRLSMLTLHLALGGVIVLYQALFYTRYWYNSRKGKHIVQWWVRRACHILAININVYGEVNHEKETLFVANHVSWLDIIALSAVVQVKFISKDSIKHWPIIGWLVTSVGTLLIRRGKYFVISRLVALIKKELKHRHSVLLFPEGTTTNGKQVAPFRFALLQSVTHSEYMVQAIALQYITATGVDLQALYIGKDNFVFHLLRLTMRDSTRLKIHFTQAFSVRNMDRHAVAKQARENILQELGLDEHSVQLPVRQVA